MESACISKTSSGRVHKEQKSHGQDNIPRDKDMMSRIKVIKGGVCALMLACVWSAPLDAQVRPSDEKASATTYEFNAEYRARSVRIEPMDLSSIDPAVVQWTEQRLRLDSALIVPKLGRLNFQADVLDGVLWGDNGSFIGSPRSNSGISIAAKKPNMTRWRVGLPSDSTEDPLNPDSYVPVLEEAPLMEVNYLYADVILPIGLLRVGRQPLNYGDGIAGHDGGAYNRFGVSQYSDAVDRILFGTKLDEAIKLATRDNHVIDTSLDNGLVMGLFYDFMKQDRVQRQADDLRQMGLALDFRRKNADWLGFDWKNVRLGGNAVYVRNEKFDSDILGLPLTAEAQVENLTLRLLYIHTRGQTREISEGFAALGNTEPKRQQLKAHGAQATADLDLGRMVLTMEFDYASGDADPRNTTPITSFSFARDKNVGALLFEHIMAFETARSVAVGVENLSQTDVESFPLTEVQSDGRFTNAIAIFPQVYVDLVRNKKSRLWLRTGALFAWPEDGGVVDPIMTTLKEDGQEVDDDLVNFHGGSPGSYYGTEIDGQIGWKYKKHFQWVVEGAVLFPGDALQDENGDAANSYLLENRFIFNF